MINSKKLSLFQSGNTNTVGLSDVSIQISKSKSGYHLKPVKFPSTINGLSFIPNEGNNFDVLIELLDETGDV
jgi:hypothetical protein